MLNARSPKCGERLLALISHGEFQVTIEIISVLGVRQQHLLVFEMRAWRVALDISHTKNLRIYSNLLQLTFFSGTLICLVLPS
jgi:hypothetical protein